MKSSFRTEGLILAQIWQTLSYHCDTAFLREWRHTVSINFLIKMLAHDLRQVFGCQVANFGCKKFPPFFWEKQESMTARQ